MILFSISTTSKINKNIKIRENQFFTIRTLLYNNGEYLKLFNNNL